MSGFVIKNKMKKIILITVAAACLFVKAAAQEKSPLSVYASFDGAYYPHSMNKTESLHFSPVTGVYQECQARIRAHADYKIDTPLGSHFLLSGANVGLNSTLEITPITIRPMFNISFSPVPFLVFKAGGAGGFGWKLMSFDGVAETNTDTAEYEHISSFKHLYYDYFAGITFQFDTGALVPGKWTHILILADYQVINKNVTGLKKGVFGKWQGTDNFANGWQYDFNAVLAWQLPFRVYRVGVMGELFGYLEDDAYGEYSSKDNYNSKFMNAVITPMMQIHISKSNDLTLAADFANRRAYSTNHEKPSEEPFLNYVGHEWIFSRIAFSIVHTFK